MSTSMRPLWHIPTWWVRAVSPVLAVSAGFLAILVASRAGGQAVLPAAALVGGWFAMALQTSRYSTSARRLTPRLFEPAPADGAAQHIEPGTVRKAPDGFEIYRDGQWVYTQLRDTSPPKREPVG